MEKKTNKAIDTYLKNFKDEIKYKCEQSKLENVNDILQFIYDYQNLVFDKEHFQKRKRVKNHVPIYDRCCAKRANNERCTRRKKDGGDYCGTHLKGTPHGIFDNTSDENKVTTQKIEVWAQDIKGIIYYIDKSENVYETEDIVNNKTNPKIIAKYEKIGTEYSIPEFGI